MVIHQIHDLTNTYVRELLINGLSKIDKSNPYCKNYHPDFQHIESNLFSVLDNGRYIQGKGKYLVLEDDNQYIGSAGWNEYELDTSVALILTRMYTDVSHRMNYHIGKYLLPIILDEVKDYEHIYATTNQYNKKIYNWFIRTSQGKSGSIDKTWPDIYKNFKPIGIMNIYYTDQFVLEYQK